MANSVVNQVKVGSTTYDMKPYLGSATSGDAASATAWTSVDAIATSDSYDTVFNKVTKMVKNVRYLYSKLGTTDFSGISSTVSGALTTLNSGKSDTTHNHDSAYAAKSHSHSNYSLTTHTHSNYSTTGHTHSNYASSTHNHDSAYAAKTHSHSEYSTTGHTHSNYSTTGHTHSNYSTTGHTHSYIATSNIVTSQTNSTSKVPAASLVYSMNSTLSSLNDALPHRDIVSSDCDASSTDSYINFISLEGKIYGQFVIITQIRFKVLYNMTISNDFKRIVRLNLPSSLYYAYGFYVMISYIANASNKLRLVVDGTSIGIYGLYGDPATISAGTYSNTETGYFTYR